MHRTIAAIMLLLGAVPALAASPECAADAIGDRVPSSVGDPRMAPLLDSLLAGYRRDHSRLAPPLRWDHRTDAAAAGSLMFEQSDMAAMLRSFVPAELAPYDHQFRGDMMKTPLMIQIANRAGTPAWIAVNRRPDSPLPGRVANFLSFALSDAGQAAIARTAGFSPLDPALREAEKRKFAGFVAPLAPGLPAFRPESGLAGEIRSVGSDGMKSLIESWMCRLAILQPGVARGERWEHLGTLNGFHALLVGETDIAPMGRELWPQELEQWRATFGEGEPLEIAVARGGFNTPQRTTAQVIFVHPDNPLTDISLDQLRAILEKNPTITRWGQLGLKGAWENKPIQVRTPPLSAPNAMSVQIRVLQGGPWNGSATPAPIAETAQAILADPGAIGFGGMEEGAPGLKALALSDGRGQPVAPTSAHAADGRYPLTRYMYIRLHPGKISPQVRALLRFILSRDGQERVRYSGYFPLTAAEAERELAKLNNGGV